MHFHQRTSLNVKKCLALRYNIILYFIREHRPYRHFDKRKDLKRDQLVCSIACSYYNIQQNSDIILFAYFFFKSLSLFIFSRTDFLLSSSFVFHQWSNHKILILYILRTKYARATEKLDKF